MDRSDSMGTESDSLGTESIIAAMDAAIPLVEEVIRLRAVFAQAAPQSLKIIARGELDRAEGVLNNLCVGILTLKGGAAKW